MVGMGQKHETKSVEADPYHISLYLVNLSKSCSSPAPITEATAAIAWAHRMAGVNDPTQMSLVKSTSEGLRRSLSKPTVKKEPITPSMLIDMVDSHIKRTYSSRSHESKDSSNVSFSLHWVP